MSETIFDLIKSNKAKAPEGYTFYLDGDLNQMLAQKNFLIEKGFDVQQSGSYPVLNKEDMEAQ